MIQRLRSGANSTVPGYETITGPSPMCWVREAFLLALRPQMPPPTPPPHFPCPIQDWVSKFWMIGLLSEESMA